MEQNKIIILVLIIYHLKYLLIITSLQKKLAVKNLNISSKNIIEKKPKTYPISLPKIMEVNYSSCSFCKGIGHRITNFPIKNSFGLPQYKKTLMKYIEQELTYIFLSNNNHEIIIHTDVSSLKGVCNFFIHQLHANFLQSNSLSETS